MLFFLPPSRVLSEQVWATTLTVKRLQMHSAATWQRVEKNETLSEGPKIVTNMRLHKNWALGPSVASLATVVALWVFKIRFHPDVDELGAASLKAWWIGRFGFVAGIFLMLAFAFFLPFRRFLTRGAFLIAACTLFVASILLCPWSVSMLQRELP